MLSTIAPRMALLLIFFPLVTYAKNETSVDKFAEAKAEPQGKVPVIKLEDIMAGKYSGKKSEAVDKKDTTQSAASSDITEEQTEQKKPPVESTETVKPMEKKSINLEEAYSALMNSDHKDRKDNKKIIKSPTPVNTANVAARSSGATGWIYLGKFS